MKSKVLLSLLILGLNIITPVAYAEEVTDYEPISFTVMDIGLRASSIVLNTGWSFGKDYCDFSIDFLQVATGNGTVTLQKKVGNSWTDYKDLGIRFKNIYSFGSSILVSNLSSGDYRLKFYLTVNGVTETLYTWEKTL